MDSLLTDVRYAIKQLEPLVAGPTEVRSTRLADVGAMLTAASDRIGRALDALERVEEGLQERINLPELDRLPDRKLEDALAPRKITRVCDDGDGHVDVWEEDEN